MAYYNATEDLRAQIALAQSIGSGFGAAFGYRAYLKEKRKKEFQEQLLKNSEMALVSTISRGQAQGWDSKTLHQEILKIPSIIQTETYQNWVMSGRAGRAIQTTAPMDEFKYWADEERKAREASESEDASKDPNVIFARQQKERVMKRINPDWLPPVPTDQPELHFKGYGKETKPAEEKRQPKGEIDVIEELSPEKAPQKEGVISTKSPQDILSAAQKVTRINKQIKELKKRFNLSGSDLVKLEQLLMNDEPIDRIIEYITTGKVK